jgi:hypothetical protein
MSRLPFAKGTLGEIPMEFTKPKRRLYGGKAAETSKFVKAVF